VNNGYPTKSLLQGREIAGLDITKGIQRFGDNEQAYLDVLHSYVATVNSILDDIESVNEETLDSYKIKVHGIKGTSFDIFADITAEKAKELEAAGKAGDLEFINKNHPSFLENAWNLVRGIEETLANLEMESNKPLRDSPDIKILHELMAACQNFDMGGADNAMAELEKYKYESDNDLVLWLRNSVDRMQFEEIVQKLNSIT
jgi:HPt (histidine-containing phosphotransfer) domain-containing protein